MDYDVLYDGPPIREGGIMRSIPVRKLRPVNCDKTLGTAEICEFCGMFHLRPGYCGALDSVNPLYKRLNRVTLSEKGVTLSPDVTLRNCDVCGVEFTPKRATAKFCSSACRKKASRK